jgi:DNA-binding beta-propeller fold protein YncE
VAQSSGDSRASETTASSGYAIRIKELAAGVLGLALNAESWHRRTASLPRQFLITLLAAGASFAVALYALTNSNESHNAAAQCSETAVSATDTEVAHATKIGRRPRVIHTIRLPARPAALAVAREGVWVTTRRGVSLLDPKTYAVSDTIPVGGPAFGIAVSSARLWVSRRDGHLVSIDRSERQVIGNPLRYGPQGSDVAVGAGSVWVNNYPTDPASSLAGTVTRVNGCSGDRKAIQIGIAADSLRFGFGALWVTDSVQGAVVRLDPATDRVTTAIGGLEDPANLAMGATGIWVTERNPGRLRLIDVSREELTETSVPVGSEPSGIALDGQAVWVPSSRRNSVTAVPLVSPRDTKTVKDVGRGPSDVALGFDRVWVANNSSSTVSVVRP